VPCGGLDAAESHKPGPRIQPVGDVFRLQPSVTKRDLPDVVALPRQLAPWVVIRAVLQLADDDIFAQLCRAELCGDEPCRGRDRRDQRNIGCIGPDQSRHRRPRLVRRLLAADVVEADATHSSISSR
jgi:hypothetical protein